MTDPSLTQEFVKSRFEYRDGNLYWISKNDGSKDQSRWNSMFAGKRSGCFNIDTKYIDLSVNFNGKRIQTKLHRIIFLYHHGFLPKEIDHINGIKDDNRIENLKGGDKFDNQKNRRLSKNNTSGICGVFYRKDNKKWRVNMISNGVKKSKHFDNLFDAACFRKSSEIKMGYSSRHGERQEEQILKSIKKISQSTDIAGVSWQKRDNKFSACIGINGKRKYLGLYYSFFDACCARKSAEIHYNI